MAFPDTTFTTGTTITSNWLNAVNDKCVELVSIKDFGAIGDGVTNDTTAFEAMVTHCSTTGNTGFIPAGTYLINPSSRTFSGNVSFKICGEGRDSTVLKNSNTSYSFIYWDSCNGVEFENLTIDGSFTGLPSSPTSGGTMVFVNSNDNGIRNIDFINIYRVALMIYNDHQTTTSNVYGGHVIDNCRAYGPSNYINNVGPSAFLLADVNNTSITNCYINQIGLYGYEFKNDCSNTIISNCIAEDVYYPIYYGGDGAHTELGYVKKSLVENCIVNRAQSGAAIFIGLASNNTINNINIDQTNASTSNYPVYITNSSNNNTIRGIDLKGRTYYAVNIAGASSGNVVHFTNINDGSYSGRGLPSLAADCSNNTVIFGNRDSTQQLVLDSYSINSNTVIDDKYNWKTYNLSASSLVKQRIGDIGADALPGAAKGFAYVANQCDQFFVTNQSYHFNYVGTLAKHDNYIWRYDFAAGEKREYLYDTGTATTATYSMSKQGFYPNEDNVRILGGSSARWSTVYAGTGTINTSDAREKQDVSELEAAEIRVAKSLKQLVRKFRFKDAVEKKGDDARIHFGVIAQDVKSAFEREGLDGFRYALLCWDEWAEQPEELDEHGNVITLYRPAGNRYGVRYDELMAFIIGAM